MSRSEQGRREFFKQVAAAGLAVAGASASAAWLHNRLPDVPEEPTAPLKSYDVALGPSDVRMAIAHGTSVDRMVRAAVGEMGGIGKFIAKGDTVFIKPNVGFDRTPALGATTHPDVIRAVATMCREAGARKIIVADNSINNPEGSFQKSGILKAAEDVGAVVMYPRPDAFRPVALAGEALGTWPVFHRPLAEATKLIGIAPTKDHNLCRASLTMKNLYGLLGGSRSRLHQRIHTAIADLTQAFRPTLVFLDATRLLMSNGPTGGSLSDVAAGDTIVCGVDPVAIDAYGFTLLKREPEAQSYLEQAHARGIGTREWKTLAYREISV